MYRGHHPEAITDYAWRDIRLYLELETTLDVRNSLGGVAE